MSLYNFDFNENTGEEEWDYFYSVCAAGFCALYKVCSSYLKIIPVQGLQFVSILNISLLYRISFDEYCWYNWKHFDTSIKKNICISKK